jgi:glycosyltransferase involved in cell wall biosynthesis
MDQNISIVMPIHNQELIVDRILMGIYKNSSENVKELIIILDGCTDNTKVLVENFLEKHNKNNRFNVTIFVTPNIFEVKSCNIGFKQSIYPWIINLQDDIEILEKDFDQRLMQPFLHMGNILGVTGRDAANVYLNTDNEIVFGDLTGRDADFPCFKERNKFYIRDIINRAPILFDHKKLEELNYLDEDFAPICQDDTDLFLRAYKEKGYLCGSYLIEYNSPLEWGGTRKSFEVSNFVHWSEQKNMQLLKERHYDIIVGEKHNFEINI